MPTSDTHKQDNIQFDPVEKRRFVSFDGAPISYVIRHCECQTKAIVIIVHGLGEHGARYIHFADALAEAGIQSFVPDLRGFGTSGGPRGHVNKFGDYLADLEALHAWIARNNPGKPLFILGHSLGGLIVSTYVANKESGLPISGMILSSPFFGMKMKVPLWKNSLAQIFSRLFPMSRLRDGVDPADLTHDRAVLEEYAKDPLMAHEISLGLYREILLSLKGLDLAPGKIQCPTLILQAGEDKIVSKEATSAFYEKQKSTNKRLIIYDRCYHELLQETERRLVYKEIIEWITNLSQ